jgi:hypothetical protein
MSDDGTRVRDQQGQCQWCGETPLRWETIESVQKILEFHASLLEERERLKEALEKLTKAGNKVALKGAETGPQWLDLTMALLSAKATLSSISSGKQGDAAS